jgi:hypothetical protein
VLRVVSVVATLAVLAAPAGASAQLVLRPVQHAGQVKGTSIFVGIVHKPGNRFRAYVSDGTPERATLSVWFRGHLADDGSFTSTDHGVTLAARIAHDQARGTVTLPDGRVFSFAMQERRGALVERNFIHDGVRYRSGWIVLEDNRVHGLTMDLGEALDGSSAAEQQDLGTLRFQLGRLLRQSGIWELRLNRGRGSSAAYNRLTQVIGFMDETIDGLER